MNTVPEGSLSEAGDHHAKHSAFDQRPRYTNTHRHPTGKILIHPQKSTNIRVIYNQQYKIVHNGTRDLHQHSVNSEWRHNSQRTTPRAQPSHANPGPIKPCTDRTRNKQKTESRIIEYDTWLQTQYLNSRWWASDARNM